MFASFWNIMAERTVQPRAVTSILNPPIPGIKELNGAFLPIDPAMKEAALKEMGGAFHPDASQLQTAGLIYTHVRVEAVTNLLDVVTKKCFNSCIQYPRQSISSSEEGCMQLCTERWFDAQNIVGQRLTDSMRIENEERIKRIETLHSDPNRKPFPWEG